MMRTTALRLSALYILLFGLVALGLGFYMTSLSVSMLNQQTEQALKEELASVEHAYQRGGIALLVRTIDRRSRQPGAFLYLVADPIGRILAGNVASIEPGLLHNNGMIHGSFVYTRFGESGVQIDHKAIAAVIDLPNAMKVLVGRDLGEPERFLSIIRKAMIIAFAAMAVGAMFIWFFIGRRALNRIDQVTAASKKIMEGDFSSRLPISGASDEFDRLSINLNVMLDRINELNIGLRQVSDNVAHDLKTPLTRLRNRAENVLSGKNDPQEYRLALEAVILESDQLIRTFNAILLISRIEASASIEGLQLKNARPIVEDAAELYEPVAEEAGVEFTLGETFDAELLINRELLAQAIINLLDNAIKYAGSGHHDAKVSLSMRDQDHFICVIVSDNGPGIAFENRERVTERFVRLEESRTLPGFGIGLSMAKAVMKLHGGQLILDDNAPGLRAILKFPKTFETD